jgi:hypothetical protein
MKTLNRPMFRYGGPIKEGIMSGIREPKRNGGSMMGNNEGPRRAALVGNPIYPNVDGRTNHFIPALLGAGAAALRYLPAVYRGIRGAKYVKGLKPTGIFRNVAGKDPSPAFVKGDPTAFAGSYGEKLGVLRALKDPTRLGGAIRENPGTASSIASLLGYGGKKLFNNEPENKNNETNSFGGGKRLVGTSGSPGGGDPGAYLEPRAPEKAELTAEEIEAAEAAARMKKMDSYREIMNIKGMSKDAAYKSLIDASQIIANNGNLKEGIKDGSLISKLTAAASQRFDKPRATEDALNSLLVKSKIESDLRNEAGGPLMQQAKDLVAAGGASNIKEAMEYLSKKPSITETATTFAKQFGKGFIDESTAVLAMQETFKERPEIVLSEKIFEDKKKEEGFKGAVDLFEKLKGQKKLEEGYYVIGGNGFVIDERGNTKQIL